MIQRLSDTFGVSAPQEIDRFIRLFDFVLSDEKYKALILSELSNGKDFDRRKTLLEFGNFNLVDLFTLLAGIDPNKAGVRIPIVKALLTRLIDWGLVFDNDFDGLNQYARYSWSKPKIALFKTLDILDNIFRGRQHIVEKYAPSIPAIVVEKDGIERIGTGFLVNNHYSDWRRGFLITARHNVDPYEGIKFLRLDSNGPIQLEILNKGWTLHSELDLAAVQVATSATARPIYPLGDPNILSPTIALGYPGIATADGPYLLAHSGELNAVITSYLDRKTYLVISNDVSPGSSGGPIFDEVGLCVGMVVRALETEHEGGISRRNVAIPAAVIQEFIQTLPQG